MVDGVLTSNHMVLLVNRNTNQITGTYYTSQQNGGYALTYNKDGYHLLDEVRDETIRNEILNDTFMFQYLKITKEELNSYHFVDKKYNYNTEDYGLHYALEDSSLLDQIKEHYKIKIDVHAAKSILENDGSGAGLRIVLNNEEDVEIDEQISFVS